jgi:hypothetical protein
VGRGDAWAALALEREGTPPTLLALRVRLLCGRPLDDALADAPPDLARRIRADLAALEASADVHAELDAPGARARWLASREELSAAREVLVAAGEPGRAAPADVAPRPEVAREARDLGWAWLLCGDRERARTLAQIALRGLPRDLDALALAARCEATPGPATEAIEAAAQARLASLDGACGRGLVVADAAMRFGSEPLAAEAEQFLTASLAWAPSLVPVWLELGRLREAMGGTAPSAPAAVLSWDELLGPRLRPAPVPADDAARALKLAQRADRSGPDIPRLELAREAVKVDPNSLEARYQLADLRSRVESNVFSHAEWLRVARLDPGYMLRAFTRWKKGWEMFGGDYDPMKDVRQMLDADPEDPAHRVGHLLAGYFGQLYPKSTRPVWPKIEAATLQGWIDGIVREDPRWLGLLYLRAHLSELAARPELADRDLGLLGRVAAERRATGHAFRRDFAHMAQLYRALIYAQDRPAKALAALEAIPEGTRVSGQDEGDLAGWLVGEPLLSDLQERPRFQGFLRRYPLDRR